MTTYTLDNSLFEWSIVKLFENVPLAETFLLEHGIEYDDDMSISLQLLLEKNSNLYICASSESFLQKLSEFLDVYSIAFSQDEKIESISIVGGNDKSGEKESVEYVNMIPGDILALVGPTGSGKSRLLADIEWLATGDTPSGRKVLLNGRMPERDYLFRAGKKIVAQLSQTMTFTMDTTVCELLQLHAESRGINADQVDIHNVIDAANRLTGESFSGSTPLTNLSGGQSRALMIADTAFLCSSPIVLIDEVENAGIDRHAALDVLYTQEKIVLLSTHDPLLALLAPRRICLKNGGMSKLLCRSETELNTLAQLETLDKRVSLARNLLREGKEVITKWS